MILLLPFRSLTQGMAYSIDQTRVKSYLRKKSRHENGDLDEEDKVQHSLLGKFFNVVSSCFQCSRAHAHSKKTSNRRRSFKRESAQDTDQSNFIGNHESF
jgi:hypothetical protein